MIVFWTCPTCRYENESSPCDDFPYCIDCGTEHTWGDLEAYASIDRIEHIPLIDGLGYCQCCRAEEYPVDAQGNHLVRGDENEANQAVEYYIDHEPDCRFALLQQYYGDEPDKTK